jgi:hypothetical protein
LIDRHGDSPGRGIAFIAAMNGQCFSPHFEPNPYKRSLKDGCGSNLPGHDASPQRRPLRKSSASQI